MKATELIKELQDNITKYGDLDVYVVDEEGEFDVQGVVKKEKGFEIKSY